MSSPQPPRTSASRTPSCDADGRFRVDQSETGVGQVLEFVVYDGIVKGTMV